MLSVRVELSGSLYSEQFHIKYKRRIGRNHISRASAAVPQLRRYSESGSTPHVHQCEPFVPSTNDLARAKNEAEWFPAIPGAVELLAVFKRSGVVNNYGLPFLRNRPVPFLNDFDSSGPTVSSGFLPASVIAAARNTTHPASAAIKNKCSFKILSLFCKFDSVLLAGCLPESPE